MKEPIINPVTKRIMVVEPVSIRELYSTLKDLWTRDSHLVRYPFPMTIVGIYNGVIHVEMEEGWVLDGQASYDNLIADNCWHCNRSAEPGILKLDIKHRPPSVLPPAKELPVGRPTLWQIVKLIFSSGRTFR